ncbi:MAG: polymorphic toxin type 23 domain-containing protein [Cryomorphaceae bacterium]|nr:hypothetical protein [Flavobacteriales bacterium]
MSRVSIKYHFSNTIKGQSGCRAHSGAAKVQNPNALETLIRNDLDVGQDGYLHVLWLLGAGTSPYSHEPRLYVGAYACPERVPMFCASAVEWVSNGSDAKVNFDNFLVQYQRGKLRQINDYGSPFAFAPAIAYGFTIAGLNSNSDEYLNKYTSKELQTGEFDISLSTGLEMFDFGSRFYDPQLGVWFTPDPAEQFHNPYLGIGNNPVVYVDPDGEFILTALAISGLLLTDVGYDIQKAVAPVAAHIDLNFGSHANGIGLDVSVGLPQALPVNYRYDIGATYYFNRPGGYGDGWQIRNGAEWGFVLPGLQVQYGGMRYRDYSGGELLADQVVHTAQIGSPLFNVAYSNDTDDSFPWAKYVPLIPDLKKGGPPSNDRYRTASGRIRAGLFETGFFLHTGEAEAFGRVDTDGDGIRETRAFTGGNINDSKRSNGIAYFGFGGFRVGWDSEGVRNFLQNRVAHDGWSPQPLNGSRYPYVLPTDRDSRFVFQFGVF